ncbi:hypothetical protein [Nocardioides terrisoli]|uniref:hypothetical protein n=1 Tax=Nocardioides terrisoli TaxID=3388267 RepID=UPI00287BABE4|nr:hypothetical protein [Nocardioides marmorisolisilvae]
MPEPLELIKRVAEDAPHLVPQPAAEVRRRGDRRRRRRTAGAVAVAALVVAGAVTATVQLTGGNDDAVVPIGPSPRHTAPVRPTPTANAVTGEVLTHDGYGKIRLGMSLAQVRATGHVVLTAHRFRAPVRCLNAQYFDAPVRGGRGTGNHVELAVSQRHGVVAIFASDSVSTVDGIHNGSTEATTRATYPHARSEANGWFQRLSPAGQQPEIDYRFSFERGHGPVTDLFLQRSDQDCYE